MDCPEKLDVAIIGAGLSGICALIRVRQAFPTANVTVFEKSDELGGTWAKNTYPGLSCDTPSQLYSFSFALNPQWSTTYAEQAEILKYIKHVVSDFKCGDYIHTKQECITAQWLEEDLLWRISFRDTDSGRDYVRYTRFLITAVGFCDRPNDPDSIQGLEHFKGRVFHSARWDHSFEFQDKDVLVIGNGCSANQFIPYLVRKAAIRSLTQVVRSAHWLAPKEYLLVPSWQKKVFSRYPILNRLWRSWLAASLDLAFITFRTSLIGKLVRSAVQRSLRAYMQKTAPTRYHDILIPDFNFGAKRPVLDHGYLSVLHDPRVKLFKSHALRVVGPNSIKSDDGQDYQADVIVLANGFKTQELLTPMKIVGRDDAELPKSWLEEHNFASAYMGVSVHRFPNLFLLTGPNTLPSGHSTLVGIECSVEYIIRLLKHLLEELPSPTNVSLEVKADAQKAFNDRVQTRMQGLVYSAEVRNWYSDSRSGRNTLVWPGSQLDFWWSRCIRKPSWGGFKIDVRRH